MECLMHLLLQQSAMGRDFWKGVIILAFIYYYKKELNKNQLKIECVAHIILLQSPIIVRYLQGVIRGREGMGKKGRQGRGDICGAGDNQLSINRLDMSRGSKTQKIRLDIQDQVHNGPSFSLRCHSWSSVLELKQSLHKVLRVLPSKLQLLYKNIELDLDNKTLAGYDIKPNDSICVKITPHLQNSLGVIHAYNIFSNPSIVISDIIDSVRTGFAKGIKPKLSENGTSGSYFLEDSSHNLVAIFKPFDEEPFAPNNPKKYVGELGSQGFRRGIMSGESSTREVAAYMLDSEGFHGVPETTYIQFYHPSFQERRLNETAPVKGSPIIKSKLKKSKTKHGSLQRFVEHQDSIGNYGGNSFSTEQVHKIAILDIRILNCDRNDENILVTKIERGKSEKVLEPSQKTKTKKEYKLTPIDHGLSFPDSLEIYDYEIIWINYAQCLQPFSEKELEFISKIDPAKDCENLKERLDFRPICLRNFRIAQMLLKQAASAGLNIYEISQIMYRSEPNSDDQESRDKNPERNFSELEKIVMEAENIYSIVKKSGLKKTIEYQIGLIKPLNLQLVHKPKSFILAEIKESKAEEQEEEEVHNDGPYKQHVFYDKGHGKRSVSLPALRVSEEEQESRSPQRQSKKDKQKERTVRKQNRRSEEEEQEWEEIFFYYFEQMLRRFLKNKQSKQIKRGRYMSQTL